jgi:cell division septation protein DedD
MRNNETGEFEIVIGNKQIFSGFFIVVALFAVGVAMGYILGQNSPRPTKLPAETAAASTQTAAESRPQPSSPPPAASSTAPADTAQQAPADGSPQPTTQPVRDDQTAGAVKPTTPAEQPAAAPAAAPAEATAGTYWQVMAVARVDADAVVRTLLNSGFPATTSPGTKGLTRVLAGPYPDRAALGRAKTELEAHGFTNIYRVDIEADSAGKK